MASTAFVSGVSVGTASFVARSPSARCPVARNQVPYTGARSIRASSVKEDAKTALEARISERQELRNVSATEPQGFTSYAEKVNGRIAMMGFFIGLVTEIVSKDHVTIGQQMLIMFSPIVNLIHALS